MSKQTPKQQSLCNNKFDGLMNAAPHKRYKSFAVTVADWESVWLDCDPNQPLPDEGVISVWPEEMFAAAVCTDKPFWKMRFAWRCPESSRSVKNWNRKSHLSGVMFIIWRRNSTGWSEGVANG